MLKIRRPLGRLIFNMGIAIPGKTVFLIETAPRCSCHTHGIVPGDWWIPSQMAFNAESVSVSWLDNDWSKRLGPILTNFYIYYTITDAHRENNTRVRESKLRHACCCGCYKRFILTCNSDLNHYMNHWWFIYDDVYINTHIHTHFHSSILFRTPFLFLISLPCKQAVFFQKWPPDSTRMRPCFLVHDDMF